MFRNGGGWVLQFLRSSRRTKSAYPQVRLLRIPRVFRNGGGRVLQFLRSFRRTKSATRSAASENSPHRRNHKNNAPRGCVIFLVPAAGVEPARYCYQRILSPSRLPIPSRRLILCRNSVYKYSINVEKRQAKSTFFKKILKITLTIW